MSGSDPIERAREIIGPSSDDDYIIEPTRDAERYEGDAPGLASLLQAESVKRTAQQYEQRDTKAVELQNTFKQIARRANLAVLLTACMGAGVLLVSALLPENPEWLKKGLLVVVGIAGIRPVPDGRWMEQIARNLVDETAGFLRGKTHFIHDRDPLFTRRFRELLQSAGVISVRLPPRSPNLNAFAERFVLSIKSECLSRLVILGEQHLRRAIAEYVEHYHNERTHQGLGNKLIDGVPEPQGGRITRHARLGGLLNSYYREAA